MEQSAAELSAFVDRVLAATGAHQVDIVGHSEGATMPDYYIEYLGGAAKVARYVGVSGVKHGTTLHGIGTFVSDYDSLFPGAPDPTATSCASCQEFLVGSDFINAIEARAPAPGVIYTNISTRYDELVSPYTSSFLSGPNVTNITLQDHCSLDFSDHLSIISSPITGQYILNALDPAHAQPPPCTLRSARGLTKPKRRAAAGVDTRNAVRCGRASRHAHVDHVALQFRRSCGRDVTDFS